MFTEVEGNQRRVFGVYLSVWNNVRHIVPTTLAFSFAELACNEGNVLSVYFTVWIVGICQ